MPLPTPPRGQAALLLVALSLLAGMAARTMLSPFQELAKADLGLTDNQMGLVQGLALAVPVALLSVPIGRLVDRTRRVTLLLLLSLCWVAGTVATALAWDFASMFAGRMLVGLGVAGAAAAAVSLAADLSPPERRGRAMMVLGTGQAIGSALAFVAGGTLVGALTPEVGEAPWLGLAPWRGALLLAAAAMLLPAALLLPVREPPRAGEPAGAAPPALRPALAELWALRGFLLPLVVGMVTLSMADAAASIWAVPVLSRSFGLQPAEFGGWMGLLLLGSGIGGTVAGGFLADWGSRRFGRGGVLVGALLGSALSVPAACFPVAGSVPLFAALLALMMLSGGAVGVVTTTAVALLVPNHLRGLCVSLLSAVGVLVSLGLAPSMVSLLSGLIGGEAAVGDALTLAGVATSLVACASFLLAIRAVRRTPV